MTFWDSSALVPLIVEEPASDSCRALLFDSVAPVVWTLTLVEVVSSLRRKEREGGLDPSQLQLALARLDALATAWTEVASVGAVKAKARRLLAVHSLRAADSLQLAAALVIAEDDPARVSFVTRDVRLRDAALREGFVAPSVP